jgi:hypothetical protein
MLIVAVASKHHILTANDDGGIWYPLQTCKFLKLKEHHLHFSFEKIIIERTIQYIKNRTDNLMIISHAKERISVNYGI